MRIVLTHPYLKARSAFRTFGIDVRRNLTKNSTGADNSTEKYPLPAIIVALSSALLPKYSRTLLLKYASTSLGFALVKSFNLILLFYRYWFHRYLTSKTAAPARLNPDFFNLPCITNSEQRPDMACSCFPSAYAISFEVAPKSPRACTRRMIRSCMILLVWTTRSWASRDSCEPRCLRSVMSIKSSKGVDILK